jgi:hypothetical protein
VTAQQYDPGPHRMTLTRDVTREECWWLLRDYAAGEELWTFTGHTYGAVDARNGVAMSERPGESPFFQFPSDALSEAQP